MEVRKYNNCLELLQLHHLDSPQLSAKFLGEEFRELMPESSTFSNKFNFQATVRSKSEVSQTNPLFTEPFQTVFVKLFQINLRHAKTFALITCVT